MHVADVDALRHDLAAYRSEWEDPATRVVYIEAALPRILGMLALVPEGDPESRLLELGSAPFFTSLCLDLVWPGQLTLANYSGTGEKRGKQQLVSAEGGPDKLYEFDDFNVETDEFPYADGIFDVVVFSELIEHLAVNPVWALAEIHRVLKPGGHVIVTTPNALSLDRFATLLHGGADSEQRYMPLLGYGARHNREWRPAELRELLESTGFDIEEMTVRDLEQHSPWERLRRAGMRLILRFWSRQPRQTHILLRARRRSAFRWHFPPTLYDQMGLYRVVRHPFVEMGVNDAIQCAGGWRPVEDWPEAGGCVRRVNGDELEDARVGFATAFLRGRAGATQLLVRLHAVADPGRVDVPGTVRVRSVTHGWEALARQRFTVRPGEWVQVAAPLTRPVLAREELEIHLEVGRGIEIAVRRLWLDG